MRSRAMLDAASTRSEEADWYVSLRYGDPPGDETRRGPGRPLGRTGGVLHHDLLETFVFQHVVLGRSIDRIAAERTRLAEGLAALGLKIWPSAANFVSCVLPGPAAPAMAALEDRGILVRDWRDPDHLNELRIGVGTAADTDAVVAALAAYLGVRAP